MPDQQQQPIGNTLANNPEAVPSSSCYSSSGSIGPFFAVISVLTVFAVLSCVFGRIYSRRQATLVTTCESIKGRSGCSCFGWVKRKFMWQFMPGDVEVASKVMVLRDEKSNAKVTGVEVPHPDPQP